MEIGHSSEPGALDKELAIIEIGKTLSHLPDAMLHKRANDETISANFREAYRRELLRRKVVGGKRRAA